MKKQNQIEKQNSRTSALSQGENPETKRCTINMPRALKEAVQRVAKSEKQSVSKLAEKAIRKLCAARKRAVKVSGADVETITIVATPQTGLPGVIYKKRIVQMGRFNWKPSEFEEALSHGRFLITALNQFHRLALELEDRWCDYVAFLEVLADGHIQALRGSVPLYWIETHDGGRNVALISLRGREPGEYPNDPKSAKDARTLESEIQHRALESDGADARSRRIADLSNKFIRTPRGAANERQRRLLQIAYIAAHSTPQELSDFCNALEAIIEPI
jgi:hypothetical protein